MVEPSCGVTINPLKELALRKTRDGSYRSGARSAANTATKVLLYAAVSIVTLWPSRSRRGYEPRQQKAMVGGHVAGQRSLQLGDLPTETAPREIR